MSMISELINRLNEISRELGVIEYDYAAKITKDAADTIEALSAKLAAANMERSDQYYSGGGWIPVSERLPDEPTEGMDDIDELDEYIVMIEDADIPTSLLYAGDGEWYRDGDFYRVTAWMPLPKPYNTDRGIEE